MKNFYAPPGGGGPYTLTHAMRHVREAGSTPDGQPIPAHLKQVLNVLAQYWPEIRPTLDTLARDTGLRRSTIALHLHDLDDLGLVRTHKVGRTAYRLLDLGRMIHAEPRRRTA